MGCRLTEDGGEEKQTRPFTVGIPHGKIRDGRFAPHFDPASPNVLCLCDTRREPHGRLQRAWLFIYHVQLEGEYSMAVRNSQSLVDDSGKATAVYEAWRPLCRVQKKEQPLDFAVVNLADAVYLI